MGSMQSALLGQGVLGPLPPLIQAVEAVEAVERTQPRHPVVSAGMVEAGHMPGAEVWVGRITARVTTVRRVRMVSEKAGFGHRAISAMTGEVAVAVEVAALHRHSHRDLFIIFPTLWLEALVAQVEMVPLAG